MVVTSPMIRKRAKVLLACLLASWLTIPLTVLNTILCQMYPMSLGIVLDISVACLGGMALSMYVFGYIKQHPIQR